MSKGFYSRLAWTGIRKNKQLYYPYLLSGAMMTAVFYILYFLSKSETVDSMPGGAPVTLILFWGTWLVALFSVPFLFYTSISLTRKRKKEFGLYNILGMNKKNIIVVLLWETLMTYAITSFTGIFLGCVFSKAAELALVNIMREKADFHIYISIDAVFTSLLFYAIVYFLIFINMVREIHHTNPAALLQSESAGERPPKSRGILAICGILSTAAAYIISLSTDSQATHEIISRGALCGALIALGTFLLFITGSVSLCRLLQKNKRYYYKTSHFVSTSSLCYRMKRNGASLASICILSTLILAALVSLVGFYAGTDGILESHYPFDISISTDAVMGVENDCKNAVGDILRDTGTETAAVTEIYSTVFCVPAQDGVLDISYDLMKNAPEEGKVTAWNTYLKDNYFVAVRTISLADYNRLCGTQTLLNDGEVLVAGGNAANRITSVKNWNEKEYPVKTALKKLPLLSGYRIYGSPLDVIGIDEVILVVPDMKQFWGSFNPSEWASRNEIRFLWEYSLNLEEERDKQLSVASAISERASKICDAAENPYYTCYSRAEREDSLYGLTGGLLFFAFALSIVFIFIAALIMYYKQISEGYEDRKQFSIMRKIGMTEKEIRNSINSQMLTVFFFPLLAAGIHLIFIFQLIYQMMITMVAQARPLYIKVAVISFILFAIVYTFTYLMTTKTYLKIVNRTGNG